MEIVQQILLMPLFSLLGLVVALTILARDLRKHERPSASIAWLASIVVLPIVAAPAYLLFANRKLNRVEIRRNGNTEKNAAKNAKSIKVDEILETYGMRPKRPNNRVEFIDEGVTAYETLSDLIDSSNDSIHLMTFIFSTDDVGRSIAEKLSERAESGVDVRVLVDAIGSWKARIFLLRRMRRAGVKVAVYLPALFFWRKTSANLRNHRKIAVFDGLIAFAGGMNIGEEYLGPKKDPKQWIDSSSVYTGGVVSDLHEIFIDDWNFTTEDDLRLPQMVEKTDHQGVHELQVVVGGPDVARDPLYDAMLSVFHRATNRIWICTPYFVPDSGLMRVLEMQSRAGLDVRIYVPKHSDSRTADFVRNRMFRRLKDAGVTIAAHPNRMVHAKHILIDDEIAITGSANLDIRSLYINFEIAIFAYDEASIRLSEGWFDKLAKDFTASPIPKTTKLRALSEDLCWLLSPLL